MDRALLARANPLSRHDRGKENRTVRVVTENPNRFLPQLWREVDQIVDRDALLIVRKRTAVAVERNRLRRGIPLTGRIAFGNGTLFDGPHRLTVRSIEHIQERLLRWLRERLDAAAIYGDVGKDRRTRKVVIPHSVMHALEMPQTFPG